MRLERTAEGLEARLRPRGAGRFFVAGFLTFWLCGWAAGEAFALWTLANMARAVVEGEAPPNGFGIGAAIFLLVWLTLWTFGGLAAMREWLRIVASEDRIVAGPTGLRIHRRIGPFRSTEEIDHGDLRRIYSVARRSRLLAETARGATVEITTLATADERQEIERAFASELGLDRGAETAAGAMVLPAPWVETIDAEGQITLIENPAGRRTAGRVAWVVAIALGSGAWALVSRAAVEPSWGALAAMASAAALLAAWGAWRLTTTRLEWRIGPGRVALRRRTRAGVRDLFEATALELNETSDSDNDAWFTLSAVAPDGTARRTVARTIHDPTAPRALGRWIAAKAGVPLSDRAGEVEKAKDLAAALAQLEASGRFGRWIARRIDKA